MVLSYPTLRGELTKSDSLLQDSWEACVLDEGHYIRNVDSQVSEAVRSVKANHRIVLTGTPVQNCLDDIFGIFVFVAPGFFSSYDAFFDYYVRPICQGYRSKKREAVVQGVSCVFLLSKEASDSKN